MRAIKLRLGHCLSTIVVLTSALYLSGGSRAAEPSVKKKTEKVLKSFRKHTYKGTLATIQKKRFLRVLTTHNSFNYYIFQGQQKGYEYNIAKRFVKFLNKKYKPKKGMPPIVFEMVPVRRDQLIPMLLDGSGDIIAAGLTATPERMKSMRFTTPYNQVSELLISRETDKSIQQVSDLAGLKIAIRKSSSYRESLERINQQLTHLELPPVQLEFVNEDLETENIVELVALGKYD